MLDFTGLNWWAILLATGAAFALGGLWYGPMFGQAWLRALGKTAEDLQPSPTPFVVGFIAASMASDSAFCRSGMPLFLVQSGYRVLYSIIMGGILGAWA